MYMKAPESEARGANKAERAKWFSLTQTDALRLIAELALAVRVGDVYEVNNLLDLVRTQVDFLNANDPRRDSAKPKEETHE